MIIGINGYSGTGKDTVGKLIQYLTFDWKSSHLYVTPTLSEFLEREQQGYYKLGYNTLLRPQWEVKKWAGKLKTIATMLTGIPQEKFEDQEFKKTNLGPEWDCNPIGKMGTKHREPMTVREFLQKLGTDGLRDGLHENTWVNALMADYKPGSFFPNVPAEDHAKLPNWIITDTRFPNEAEAIKKAGGIIIRVDRPGIKAINDHPSEIGLDDWNFDHKIMNASDLVALSFTVEGILKKENLL